MPTLPLRTRIEKHSMPEPNSGCWIWLGGVTDAKRGAHRAKTYFNGSYTSAARVAWTMEHGQIPAGLFVLHKCDTPLCVNPAHLFLGTHQDNVADAMAKGRYRNAPSGPRRQRTNPIGVSQRRSGKWFAYAYETKDGKYVQINLGTHPTKEAATEATREYAATLATA